MKTKTISLLMMFMATIAMHAQDPGWNPTGVWPFINKRFHVATVVTGVIKLKKTDLFLELGLGCDFYLPYFKLRPELKFMYGITDTYDKNHIKNIKDKSTLPYTLSAKSAHSKMIALTFYFE